MPSCAIQIRNHRINRLRMYIRFNPYVINIIRFLSPPFFRSILGQFGALANLVQTQNMLAMNTSLLVVLVKKTQDVSSLSKSCPWTNLGLPCYD